MVGGIIEEIVAVAVDGRVAVLVRGTGTEQSDRVGLNLRTYEKLEVGDQLWWQSRFAYWTPNDKRAHDIPLSRMGYTYSQDVFVTLKYLLGIDNRP